MAQDSPQKEGDEIAILNKELKLLVPIGINGPSPNCLPPQEIAKLKGKDIIVELPLVWSKNEKTIQDFINKVRRYVPVLDDYNLKDINKILAVHRVSTFVQQNATVTVYDSLIKQLRNLVNMPTEIFIRVPYDIAKKITWQKYPNSYPIITLKEAYEEELQDLHLPKIGIYSNRKWSEIDNKINEICKKFDEKIIVFALDEKDYPLKSNSFTISVFGGLKYKNIEAVGLKYMYIDYIIPKNNRRTLFLFSNSKSVDSNNALLVIGNTNEKFRERIMKIAKLITSKDIQKLGIRFYLDNKNKI